MTKKMLIDAAHPEEVRVAVLDQGKVEDFDFESEARKPLRGNIYLARVTRVEPSLQAAFVEYGGNRHGFLAFSEIHPDYYQIPVSDRVALQEAEAEVVDIAAQLEVTERGDEDDDDGDDRDDDRSVDDADTSNDNIQDTDTSDDDAPTDSAEEVDDIKNAADEGASEAVNEDDPTDEIEAPSSEETDEDEEEEEEDGEEDDAADTPAAADVKAEPKKRKRTRTRKKAKSKDTKPKDSAGDDHPVVEASSDDDTNDQDDNAQATNPEETDAKDETEEEAVASADEEASGDEASDDDRADDADDDLDEDVDEASDEDGDHDEARANAKQRRAERNALLERYKDAKRKRANLLRNYKIQEVIKRRQILLIQVVKEERGNKGAALTSYISLAGRYCVLMPNTARGGGISRKIPHSTDRRRLRRVVDSMDVPQGMGLIIRTAGAKRTKTEVKRDYDYLLRLWENIRSLTLKSIAPCLVYEEASLIKRAIRDLYDKDIGEVQVEGEAGYREAKDFMKMLMPSHAKHVQPHKAAAPIFLKHGVEAQLDGMYQPTVRLKSGGYIVIHQTEALIAIDVNSGRATRERNIEQTALKTNIEAAYEAARQFRLRDLAGLIVLDFIDMEEQKNNRKVEKAIKDAIKHDRARIQVGRISNFGLMEMSRQRRRSGIIDGTTQACPTCSGAGVIRSAEMAALRILRAIEGEAVSGKVGLISVHASLDVSVYILNHHRDWIKRIESEQGVSVQIIPDTDKAGDDYALEKSGTPRERVETSTVIQADQTDAIEIDEPELPDASDDADDEERDGERKKRRRRRRKKDAGPRDEDKSADKSDDDEGDEGETQKADGDGDDEQPRKRRRRGRRGGRRNRRSKSDQVEAGENDADTADVSGNANNGETPEAATPAAPEASAEDSSTNANAASQAAGDKPNGVDPQSNGHDASASHQNTATGDKTETIEAETGEAEIIDDEPQPTPSKPKKKGWWRRSSDA